MQTAFNRDSEGFQKVSNVSPDVLIENNQAISTPICDKIEKDHEDPLNDRIYYNVIGDGCIMVYHTDGNGNVESAQSYTCVIGNTLYVEGNHGFGCDC